MRRRSFLSASLAGGALGAAAFAGLMGARPVAADIYASDFRAGLAEHPWLLGYANVSADEFAAPVTRISGRLPAELTGTLFRNGPAQHEIGNFRYQHWFEGDGMIQAWRFTGDGVEHQARMIETRKYLAEKAAGRALYPGFASIPPDPRPVTSADIVNPGNISVLPHHGRLLALWEAGSAWDIDPETLKTQGRHVFSEQTTGLPFSAHPRVESDGTLWNFGYVSSAHLLVLWHVNAQGKVVNVGTVPCPDISMPHDFIVTSKHVVILISPLVYEPEGEQSFLDAHVWHPDRATRVLVVDKNDFTSTQWFELPAQWVFHFGNGWEAGDGVIHFDGATTPTPQTMTGAFRDVMRGRPGESEPPAPSVYTRYRVDTRSGRCAQAPMLGPDLESEFPVIDPRVSCQRHRRILMLTREHNSQAPHPNLNAVSLFDEPADTLQTYTYPDELIPEEHLFVPKPGSSPEGRGWILGSSMNYERARTEISVFDASAVDAGPIYQGALPYVIPLGLHGRFAGA
jgi:carotenoid cleavage dioxygenase